MKCRVIHGYVIDSENLKGFSIFQISFISNATYFFIPLTNIRTLIHGELERTNRVNVPKISVTESFDN